MNIRSALSHIGRAESLFRALIHEEMARLEIGGSVVDLGSGGKKSYAHLIKHSELVTLVAIDQKGTESAPPTNLETDIVPVAAYSADVVLAFNILEHIYHFNHVLAEVRRLLKPGGRFIGCVPFFCTYHPGPKDYFRYTHEALEQMLLDAGFKKDEIKITPLGYGPFSVGFHIAYLTVPKIWRRRLRFPLAAVAGLVLLCDKGVRRWNKDVVRDAPLGYFFVVNTQ